MGAVWDFSESSFYIGSIPLFSQLGGPIFPHGPIFPIGSAAWGVSHGYLDAGQACAFCAIIWMCSGRAGWLGHFNVFLHSRLFEFWRFAAGRLAGS